VLTLDRYGYAAVGSPPVVQVLVDVLGITVACFVAAGVYSILPDSSTPPSPSV